MAKRFTFKMHPKVTGLARVGAGARPSGIKLDGRYVGLIRGPSRFGQDEWTITLRIKDEAAHCGWRNATLKHRPTDREAAMTWLNENFTKIAAAYVLMPEEDS